MTVEYQPAWLTWVGSTATCLKALGIECDVVDVAGISGYAFQISVHSLLCPSGPTCFNWSTLIPGITTMGRSTLVYSAAESHHQANKNERTVAACRSMFNFISGEIKAGRPCVLWGTYVPEFGVVVGIEGDNYIVKSFKECLKEEQPPIPFDGIEAPGGLYALAFPAESKTEDEIWTDFYAVTNAVDQLTSPGYLKEYGHGLESYEIWIKALKKNKVQAFGNAYNAHCYWEGRCVAGEFLSRVAKRREKVAKQLNKAAEHYTKAKQAMKRMTEIFPFPPKEETIEEDARKEGIELLKDTKKAEKKALKAMTESLEVDWGAREECKE